MLLALVVLCSGGVCSAEEELDTDLMHDIEDTNKSLASNIALQQVQGAATDAQELGRMFIKVEDYFTKRGGADDAVDLSKKSRELAAQIQQLLTSKDFGAATNSATTLSRTCKTCHNFYKKS